MYLESHFNKSMWANTDHATVQIRFSMSNMNKYVQLLEYMHEHIDQNKLALPSTMTFKHVIIELLN